MAIFQSMGGRYTLGMALHQLVVRGSEADRESVRQALSERYGSKATLYHKGRAALAEAVRLATGGEGDVVVSGLTCYSVVQAVETAGCQVVFADIDEVMLQPGAAEIEAVCQQRDVKAVIVQHMLGIPADITGIEALSKKYDFTLIEDLAHAAGASYPDGREVGTVAPYSILSFGRDKALDAVNGGALIIRNETILDRQPVEPVPRGTQLRDRLYPLITWLARSLYKVGGHYIMAIAIRLKLVIRSADGDVDVTEAMPAWQAALAKQQLVELDDTVRHRQKITAAYLDALTVQIPTGARQSGASLIRLPLLVTNRQAVITALNGAGVYALDSWYDAPVGPERFFRRIDYPATACPVAVRVSGGIMNLPTHRRMTTEQAVSIAKMVNKVAIQ